MMGTMTMTEFLLARIAEDEAAIRKSLLYDDYVGERIRHTMDSVLMRVRHWTLTPARVLAECEAKRRIIALHESWPVLAETPIEVTVDPTDISGMTMRASKQMAWMTDREYRNRFGDEPPTPPMIRALAAVYADHPDYLEEWKA